eukprot:SAG22_NODE_3211_length_1855_cov_1.268223_1_plen_60_part_10
MLSPFTEENGTHFVPRSHKLGHNYLSEYDAGQPLGDGLEARQVLGQAGDCFIFDARVWQ